MPAERTELDEKIEQYRSRGLLGNKYYVVLTTPIVGREKLRELHAEHLAYQRELEKRGLLFAAGPLADDEETQTTGESMNIYRAGSLAEARAIAERDPMHAKGGRSFRIRPWIMNEGSIMLNVSYSIKKIEVR